NDSGAKAETPTFYNLVFRVIDRDGKKIVSSRSYKTSIGVAREFEGWTVTVDSRDFISPPRGTMGNDNRIGFEVNARKAMLVNGKLAMDLSGDMSSLPTDDQGAPTAAASTIVRSNRWEAVVLLSMNTPTIVYSSDDPTSTHVFQVELTASPMDGQ
ncbi:MAG: hypothetical protein WCC14_10750, partial [Acidobacteriaceae bacterium]